MKTKFKHFYILLGLVGAFWFTGCCTYPGGMVAVYGGPSRPHGPHHQPAPVVHHYAPAPHHHQQAFLPPSFRVSPRGGGHHRQCLLKRNPCFLSRGFFIVIPGACRTGMRECFFVINRHSREFCRESPPILYSNIILFAVFQLYGLSIFLFHCLVFKIAQN